LSKRLLKQITAMQKAKELTRKPFVFTIDL